MQSLAVFDSDLETLLLTRNLRGKILVVGVRDTAFPCPKGQCNGWEAE